MKIYSDRHLLRLAWKLAARPEAALAQDQLHRDRIRIFRHLLLQSRVSIALRCDPERHSRDERRLTGCRLRTGRLDDCPTADMEADTVCRCFEPKKAASRSPCQGLRNLPRTLNEELRDWAQSPVFQRDNPRPTPRSR